MGFENPQDLYNKEGQVNDPEIARDLAENTAAGMRQGCTPEEMEKENEEYAEQLQGDSENRAEEKHIKETFSKAAELIKNNFSEEEIKILTTRKLFSDSGYGPDTLIRMLSKK